MNRPLLIDAELAIEKRAYTTHLDSDPEEWPTIILRESYKQLPFLQSLETDVDLERIDSARGYAVGKMLVYPARMEKEAAAEEKRLISVPIIVRDREMAPLDVYSYGGSMYPMDEDEVQELLFRPQTFDRPALGGEFTGTNLYGQMIPPNTDHQYNAGTLHKHGSALWKKASSTLSENQVETFKAQLRADLPLRQAMLEADSTREFLEDLFAVKEKTAADRRETRLDSLKPTVIQFIPSGKDYIVKTANHNCFAPREVKASRFEVQAALGEESWGRLLQDGHLTLAVDPVNVERATEKLASVASRVGAYRVWAGGQEIEGVVIPGMVSLEGEPLDAQLFVSENLHAMQEKVAGVFTEDLHFPDNEPRGRGVFVYHVGPRALATEPLEIKNRIDTVVGAEKVAYYVGRRLSTGEPLKVYVVSNLEKVAKVGDEVYIPSSMTFLPIWGRQVEVSSTPADAHVFAHRKTAGVSSVEVISDGACYSLRGANARVFNGEILEELEAEFALGALGLTGVQARELMKTAAARGSARVPATRNVVTEIELGAQTLTKAASFVGSFPDLAVDLSREAALLAGHSKTAAVVSKETVDTILSLGFVTPENVSIYVDYLPELEKVSSKLAELLVASRLGMDEVREAAAKNAMTQINSVVKGLSTLREQIS